MGGDESQVLRLAEQVSDGKRIDWEEAELRADDSEERNLVRHLRLVASLAEVHQSRSDGEDLLDPESTATRGTLVATGSPAAEAEGKRESIGKWGHLELLEKLGEGAFGEVFLAWDAKLERRVALKLLCDRPAGGSQPSSVIEEGRLLARVDHPNVVSVYGAEEHDGRVGIWMEYVPGRTLEALLAEQGPLNDREAAMVGADLCRALAAVHGAGLVHRDVKSQNVMRAEGGRILLMDFGAGRDVARSEEPKGSITGTAMYMAPEVVRGEPATQLSDIYSLGILLYHLVTGTFPIRAKSFRELQEKHRRRESCLLRDERPGLPEPFVRAVERALAWDPEDRHATPGQMEQALRAVLGGEAAAPRAVQQDENQKRERKPTARPVRVAALAAAALILIGVTTVWVLSNRERAPIQTAEPEIVQVDEEALAAAETPPPDVAPPVGTSPAKTETRPSNRPVDFASASAGTYSVEAALYRVGATGRRERLEQGARLALGDALSLEFEASESVYLYVINEDEAGHAYALFPLPDLDLKNPLPPGTTHRIPGTRDGEPISWRVDTPGGREHLLVLASPERQVEFEAEMSLLARPRLDGQPIGAVGIPDSARIKLRGIGGLVESPDTAPTGSARNLFEMANRLASRAEVVEGVWLRQIELENPRP